MVPFLESMKINFFCDLGLGDGMVAVLLSNFTPSCPLGVEIR